MTGIYGWLDTIGKMEHDRCLQQMADTFTVSSAKESKHSSLPNTALGAQSFRNKCYFYSDDRFLVAINGEPRWTSAELSTLAQSQGHAKTLLEAYQHHSALCLRQLQGAFSLALLDKKQNAALLAVDRMGRQPLCYHLPKKGGLVFASTVSALNAHPNVTPVLNEQAIFDYLYFYMVPSPNTIYKDQWKLQPGEYLNYENGKATVDFYWQPHFTDSAKTPICNLQEEFHALLETSIQRHITDDEIGAFLSGGLDSSTVSGILAKVSDKPTKTFSIGFNAEGYDEIEYARIAAKRFKTIQHEYYVTPKDVVTAIPLIAQAYDEPYGNSSAVPTYFCAKLAKEHGVKTLLAGDGGDELFAGNARYAKQRVFELYAKIPHLLRKNLIEPLILPIPARGHANPFRKLQSYIKQARIPLPERLESYNLLHMVPLTEIFSEEFLTTVNEQHPVEHLRDVYGRAQTTSSLNRMLYLDWKTTLADNDLRKVNNMCTLAGIDVRYPLLDDELVDFSTRVPPSLKLRGNKLRYFFKQSLTDFLPDEIINKPKHGFGLPFGVWLRESPELQELANDNIADFKKRGYIRPEYLDRLIDQHRSEHAAFYGEMLWPIMMLELWLKAHGH